MPDTPKNVSAGLRRIVPTGDFVPRGLAVVAGAPVPHFKNHGGPAAGIADESDFSGVCFTGGLASSRLWIAPAHTPDSRDGL